MAPNFGSFIPWGRRHSEPEQRIHEELTETARRRVAHAVTQLAHRAEIHDTVRKFQVETGKSLNDFDVKNTGPAKQSQFAFILDADHEDLLTYLEILLNEVWEPSNMSNRDHSYEELVDLDEMLRRILFEEGILLRLRPDRETVAAIVGDQSTSSRGSFVPLEGEPLRFERLSDEAVIEADQEMRVLAKGDRWEGPLKGYNEAWEMYQDGQFSFIIAEKLYNSLESVLEEICVSEGWNSSEDTVGTYLNSLREHGLFEPNDKMVGEWQQILGGIRTGVQRTGGDRKGHEQFDQDYVILLLHQVAAFLTFLINRYEDYDP